MKKVLLFMLTLIFSASLLRAETIKVLVIKHTDPKKAEAEEDDLQSSLEVDAPSDEELGLAQKILDAGLMGVRRLEPSSHLGKKWMFIEKIKQVPAKGEAAEPKEELTLEKATAEEREEIKNGVNGLLGFIRSWEFQMGFGGTFPLSANLIQDYQTGINANFALGYKLSRSFVLVMDFDLNQFDSANDFVTGGSRMTDLGLALEAKFRLGNGPIRPYLFAGPGFASHRFTQAFKVGNLEGSSTIHDQSSFMAVGGAGVEIRITERMHCFLQGKLVYDFASNDLDVLMPMDHPISTVLLQTGILFGN